MPPIGDFQTSPGNDIHRDLGRIEGKLDELLRRATAQDLLSGATIARVGSLESWRAYVTGFAALLTLLLGFAFALILKVIP